MSTGPNFAEVLAAHRLHASMNICKGCDWRAIPAAGSLTEQHEDHLAAALNAEVDRCAHASEATDPTPGEVGLSDEERRAVVGIIDGIVCEYLTTDDVFGAVERILAARTADLRAEHAAEVEALEVGYNAQVGHARTHWLRAEDAEAREAELRATVERVEALVNLYAAEGAAREAAGKPAWPNNVARDLRAVLTTPSTTEGGK